MKSAKTLFESAKYLSILQGQEFHKSDPEFWLGALVFSGKEEEARYFFKKTKWTNHLIKIQSMFYLFLTSLRRADHADMLEDFLVLNQLYKANKHSHTAFYLYQALALLRFYRGEFKRASQWSQKAYSLAFETNEKYHSMISLDLMGHAMCMQEEYAQGFEYFKKALESARTIKNNLNSEVIQLSILSYELEAGIELVTVKQKLELWIQSIKTEDYFTIVNAKILLAKIKILEGHFGHSKKILQDIGQSIYTKNKSRQILSYNLTSIILNSLLDNKFHVMELIGTSLTLCKKSEDFYYRFRFCEIENYIFQKQPKNLTYFANKTGRKIKYNYPLFSIPESTTLELLGLNLDFTYKVNQLHKLKLLGLIFCSEESYINLKNKNFLDFRLKNRQVIFYINQNLNLIENLTSNQRRLLMILTSQKQWTRKALYESFWGGDYDSFIHDNKIYVTLKRLIRKINIDDSFLYFQKGDIYIQVDEVLNQKSIKSNGIRISNKDKRLSPRQLQFISNVCKDEIWTPAQYAKEFAVSRNTVSNDLNKLCLYGYLERNGSKKGTYYRVLAT